MAINEIIRRAITHKGVYWFISPTYRQSKQNIWTDRDMLFRYCLPEIIDKKNEVDLSVFLKNGSIISLKGADNPDALRGANPVGVIFDEYALIKKSTYDEIIRPIIAANNGWVWFIGTPKPTGTHFKELFEKAKDNPKWLASVLKASQSKIIPDEALQQAKKEMTEKAYLQEFECEWFTDEGVIFRNFKQQIKNNIWKDRDIEGHQYQIGVDLARIQDWTAICVYDINEHNIVYLDRFQHIDWSLQKSRIIAVWAKFNRAKVWIDSTGVGDTIAEDLKREGLNCVGYKFTNESKKNLIDNLVRKLESGQINIPNFEPLIDELSVFGYEISPSGTVRYSAPEGKHDDTIFALALSVWQVPEFVQNEPPFYQPIFVKY